MILLGAMGSSIQQTFGPKIIWMLYLGGAFLGSSFINKFQRIQNP